MKLYKGEVELTFDKKAHRYAVTDGSKPTWHPPGVTAILDRAAKYALIPWAARVGSELWMEKLREFKRTDEFGVPQIIIPETELPVIHELARKRHREISGEGKGVGSVVHEYVENVFLGNDPQWPKEPVAKKACEAFDHWYQTNSIICIASERKLYSRKHGYCGTADFYGIINGERVIGDIKTNTGIYPEMHLQTAAYQQAIEEEDEVKIDARYIIRLDKKTGAFEAHRESHNGNHIDAFIHLRNFHYCMTKMEQAQDGLRAA